MAQCTNNPVNVDDTLHRGHQLRPNGIHGSCFTPNYDFARMQYLPVHFTNTLAFDIKCPQSNWDEWLQVIHLLTDNLKNNISGIMIRWAIFCRVGYNRSIYKVIFPFTRVWYVSVATYKSIQYVWSELLKVNTRFWRQRLFSRWLILQNTFNRFICSSIYLYLGCNIHQGFTGIWFGHTCISNLLHNFLLIPNLLLHKRCF